LRGAIQQTGALHGSANLAAATTHDQRHDDSQHAAADSEVLVRAVKNFSLHFKRSPDKLTFGNVREYQLHLVSRGLGVQAINQIMCALWCFCGTTLKMSGVSEHIPLGRRPDALPPVLSADEVERVLN